MLPKKSRVSRKEFLKILNSGKKYNSPHILLYVVNLGLKESIKESKFSFSVSKKASSLAVDRNKYRRQGYSIINKHIKFIKPGFICLFSFKKGLPPLKFDILEKEIMELLSVSGVLL